MSGAQVFVAFVLGASALVLLGLLLLRRRNDRLFCGMRCMECGEQVTEVYMLHNSLWRQVAGRWSLAGHLHLRCAEKRLGRRIQRADLTAAPCNQRLALHRPSPGEIIRVDDERPPAP